MTRDDFTIFTKGYIAELISWAELYLRQTLPKDNVRLISYESELADGIDNVVDYLVSYTYESEESIKPCVDLSVCDFDDHTVSILFMPTGYSGQPFGLNWTGKPGPYIKTIDMKLIKSKSNKEFPKEWKLDI